MKRSILTLCLLGQVLFLWAQNQYYVAPDGNDNHDGSFQKPFQTIERAQLEARKAQGETTAQFENLGELVKNTIFVA